MRPKESRVLVVAYRSSTGVLCDFDLLTILRDFEPDLDEEDDGETSNGRDQESIGACRVLGSPSFPITGGEKEVSCQKVGGKVPAKTE